MFKNIVDVPTTTLSFLVCFYCFSDKFSSKKVLNYKPVSTSRYNIKFYY